MKNITPQEAAQKIVNRFTEHGFKFIRIENNRCYAVYKNNSTQFKFEVYLTTHLVNNFYMCQIQNWFDTNYQSEKNKMTNTIEGVSEFLEKSVKHINSLV